MLLFLSSANSEPPNELRRGQRYGKPKQRLGNFNDYRKDINEEISLRITE